MKLVKHNVIENYVAFSDDERVEIILQEMSKSLMMFPKAITEIFDTCKIKYSNSSAKELRKIIEQNSSDLKMLNKIVKLSLITNDELQKSKGKDATDKTYRQLMSGRDDFFKENQDIVQDAVLKLRELLKSKQSDKFAKEVNEYLNMDGENFDDGFKSSIDSSPSDVLKKILIIGVIIGGIYYLTKK